MAHLRSGHGVLLRLATVAILCSRVVNVAAPLEQRTLLELDPAESVLLFDNHTVAGTTNLRQEFFPARKYSGNPVLRRSEPWEGTGPYIWASRLLQDETSGLLRLWYIGYSFEGNAYRWGLAESHDGFQWTKPDLRPLTRQDRLGRNWLPVGSHPEKGALAVARDPRPATPTERRYLGIRFTYDGEFVSYSPDGIIWKEYSENPVWRVPSDIIHVIWDKRRNHFAAYYKLWEVTGTEVGTNGTAAEITAYLVSFDQKKLPHELVELTGPRVTFVTNGAATVAQSRLVLRASRQSADDGGGSSLAGDWSGKRVQAWAESEDGIHWTHEQLVLRADRQDPPTANIQFMFVMQYGGYYVGFLTLHDASGLFRQQLAWSSDGIHWQRSCREPWLDVGPTGAFDAGMVLGPTDPVILKREMAFLYGGFPITHDSPRQDWEAAVGLAMIRLDGFSAWRATGPGELITQPFTCRGRRLFVNADAKGGSLKVEVLDEAERVIKGFDAGECLSVETDTVQEESAGWLHWKNHPDLSGLEGKPIRLRFVLKDARLYSFRIADARTERLPVPRAAKY